MKRVAVALAGVCCVVFIAGWGPGERPDRPRPGDPPVDPPPAVDTTVCELPVAVTPMMRPIDACRLGLPVLGPTRVVHSKRKEKRSTFAFDVPEAGFGCVIATNPSDRRHAIGAAWIDLDGESVLTPEYFCQNPVAVEERLSLTAGSHTLGVRMPRQPHASVEVTVTVGGTGNRTGLVETEHLDLFNLWAEPPIFSPALTQLELTAEGTVRLRRKCDCIGDKHRRQDHEAGGRACSAERGHDGTGDRRPGRAHSYRESGSYELSSLGHHGDEHNHDGLGGSGGHDDGGGEDRPKQRAYSIRWTYEVRAVDTCTLVQTLVDHQETAGGPAALVNQWSGLNDVGEAVPDGEYLYRVTLELLRLDRRGHERTIDTASTAQQRVVADSTPPSIQIVSPTGGSTLLSQTGEVDLEIAYADATAGVDVASLEVLLDGQDISAQLASSSNASSGTVTLASGTHTIEAQVSDLAGNVASVTSTFDLVVDVIPPRVEIVEPPPVTGTLAHILIEFADDETGVNLTSIELTVDGQSILGQVEIHETWLEGEVALPDGHHELLVRLEDLVGNSTTRSSGFLVDTTPPQIRLSPDISGLATQAATVRVQAEVTDLSGVEQVVINGAVAEHSGGVYSAWIDLIEGRNEVSLLAIDILGHTSDLDFHVVRDNTPPVLSATVFGVDPVNCGSPIPLVPNTSNPSISLAVEDALAGVDARGGIEVLVNAVNQWSGSGYENSPYHQSITLQPHLNDLLLVARDRAGNTTVCSAVFYGTHLLEYYAHDAAIPNALLRLPADSISSDATFEISRFDAVTPGSAINLNNRARVAAGPAMDYSQISGPPLDLASLSPTQCAQIVVPYDPVFVDSIGFPEDSLRVVQLTNPASVQDGAQPVYRWVDGPTTIDPVMNTVAVCSPHLSVYVVSSLDAPPTGLLAEAYVIDNGTRAVSDQALRLIDIDFLIPQGVQFDIELPSVPTKDGNDLVLAYGHKVLLIPDSPLLAVAYRRVEVETFRPEPDLISREIGTDSILFVDIRQRKVVGAMEFDDGPTLPPDVGYSIHIPDFEFVAGDKLAIVVTSSDRTRDGIYIVDLPDVNDPENAYQTINGPPALPLHLPASVDLEIAGDTVFLRGETLRYPAAVADADFEEFWAFSPLPGFDYMTLADIASDGGLGSCLVVDDELRLSDRTHVCHCDRMGTGTIECNNGICIIGPICVSWACDSELTVSGLNPEGYADVAGTSLSCSSTELKIGNGLYRAGTWFRDPMRDVASTVDESVYDLVSIAAAAGQILAVDLDGLGTAPRSELVRSFPVLDPWSTAEPDQSRVYTGYPLFTAESSVVASSTHLWVATPVVGTELRTTQDHLALGGDTHAPHLEVLTFERTGDFVDASSRSRTVLSIEDADFNNLAHTGLAVADGPSGAYGVVVTPSGAVNVVYPQTGLVSTVGQLPPPPSDLPSSFTYSAAFANTQVTIHNNDVSATLIAGLANLDGQPDSDPESVLVVLAEDALTTERYLSTTGHGVQFETYGRLPKAPIAPLPATRDLQARFKRMPPALFGTNGEPSGIQNPVFLNEDRAHDRTVAVVLRDSQGTRLDDSALSSDVGVRVFAVSTAEYTETDALSAIEAGVVGETVRVKRYLPLESTLMLVKWEGTPLVPVLHARSGDEMDSNTERTFDVFEVGAPSAFPEATVDVGCEMDTRLGKPHFCIRGVDLVGVDESDGERYFVADLVEVGAAQYPSVDRGFQLSPASDPLVLVLDRVGPISDGPHLFTPRSGEIVFVFNEPVLTAGVHVTMGDEWVAETPVAYRLKTYRGTDGKLRSLLSLTPPTEPSPERIWYVVDPADLRDRAGNPASVVPATTGWRTRSALYDTLVSWISPDGEDKLSEKPFGDQLAALAGAFEDHLAEAVVLQSSPTQERLAALLKPLVLAAASEMPSQMAAQLYARTVQYFDADGVFVDELAGPIPQRILTRELLDAATVAGVEAVELDSVTGLVGVPLSGCEAVLENRACLVNRFLVEYTRLRRAGLVYVGRNEFMRALVGYAYKVWPAIATRGADSSCADDAVVCSVEELRGATDDRISATVGLATASVFTNDEDEGLLALASLGAIVDGFSDAVVVASTGTQFLLKNLVWQKSDPAPSMYPAVPDAPANMTVEIWEALPPLDRWGSGVTMDLLPEQLEFRKRTVQCATASDGTPRCVLVGSLVEPDADLLGIGGAYRGATSDLVLLKNVHQERSMNSELVFEMPEGVDRFDAALKIWTMGATLRSWDEPPTLVISAGSTTYQELHDGLRLLLPHDHTAFWIQGETGTVFIGSPPFACERTDNPLSLCNYQFDCGDTCDESVLFVLVDATAYRRIEPTVAAAGTVVSIGLTVPPGTDGPYSFSHGVDFGIQVDDIRFYMPGSDTPKREGEDVRVRRELAGTQRFVLLDDGPIAGRPSASVAGSRTLVVPATGASHALGVEVVTTEAVIGEAKVEVCADHSYTGAEDLVCDQKWETSFVNGLYVANGIEEPVTVPGAPPAVVAFFPLTSPLDGGSAKRGAPLLVTFDGSAPQIGIENLSGDCPLPAEDGAAFRVRVSDDSAGGYLAVSHEGDCAAKTTVGGWRLSENRGYDNLASTTVFVSGGQLCPGDNLFEFAVTDTAGRTALEETKVVGVSIPPFTVSEKDGRFVVRAGDKLEFQVSPKGPPEVEYVYSVVPGGAGDGTFETDTAGVFTASSPGLAQVTALARHSSGECTLRHSDNYWDIEITPDLPETVAIGRPNLPYFEENPPSELIDISNPGVDFIPIEIRIPGDMETSPPTVEVSVETSRGVQFLVGRLSSQRGLRVIYTERLQASTFFPQPKEDALITEVAGFDAFSVDDFTSNVDDTLAVFSFLGAGADNRTLFRGHGRPDWGPAVFGSHPPTRAYFMAGGAEMLTVRTLGAESEAASALVKNQSDIFFFSGHGAHEHGHLLVGDGVIRAVDLVDWNDGDVDVLVLSGCSVLDISNYRMASIPFVENFSAIAWYYALGGTNSVGEEWEDVDVQVLLGFAWTAPVDSGGGIEIAQAWANSVMAGEDPVTAWQTATDTDVSRNAVAIDKRGPRPVYYWWDEMDARPVWRNDVRGEEGWEGL